MPDFVLCILCRHKYRFCIGFQYVHYLLHALLSKLSVVCWALNTILDKYIEKMKYLHFSKTYANWNPFESWYMSNSLVRNSEGTEHNGKSSLSCYINTIMYLVGITNYYFLLLKKIWKLFLNWSLIFLWKSKKQEHTHSDKKLYLYTYSKRHILCAFGK